MEQLTTIAFGLSIFGGIHDLLTKKIPNWFTFPAMLLGILAQLWFFGVGGILEGFLGIILGFILFAPVYFLGYMGAGDVKLMMVVGAWIGWFLCLRVAIGAVVVGGIYAFIEILFRGRMQVVIRNSYSFLRSLLVPNLVPEKLNLDSNRKFTFGICVPIGFAIVIYLRHRGQLP